MYIYIIVKIKRICLIKERLYLTRNRGPWLLKAVPQLHNDWIWAPASGMAAVSVPHEIEWVGGCRHVSVRGSHDLCCCHYSRNIPSRTLPFSFLAALYPIPIPLEISENDLHLLLLSLLYPFRSVRIYSASVRAYTCSSSTIDSHLSLAFIFDTIR